MTTGCPDCGCRHGSPAGEDRWFGRVRRWLRCRHCNRRYPLADDVPSGGGPAEDDGVVFQPVRCPRCGSKKVPVAHTEFPARHHKCSACGHSFKSVEI